VIRIADETHASVNTEIEQRASRIGSVLLSVLAVYVAVSAVYGLWMRQGQEFSTPGLVLAILVIPIMWWLATAKIRIADQIGSRALRADAVESITCGYLSGTVVLGLVVQLLMDGGGSIASRPGQSSSFSLKRVERLGKFEQAE
jgi:divalent metal cation (Fe/Co/Zn/Cd) transporter